MQLNYPGRVIEPNAGANFERIRALSRKELILPEVGGNQVDIAVPPEAITVEIDWGLEFSGLAELRLLPNALGTNIYGDIRDGSYETSGPSAVAVVAQGAWAHSNGLRLAFPPQVAVSGGVQATGRALFYLKTPSVAGALRRTCTAQGAVTSTTGSGNHAIELQNIASVIQVAATVITSLRFAVNTGTMIGSIGVTFK